MYCHDPHRTVGILLCVFALPMTVNFLMLSTQPDFLRHGMAFPSPPRKTASSSLTDGQSVLPLLVLLTFGGSIHGSSYLNQPEALYATPTTRMILFVLCRLTGGHWQKWKRVFLTCPCHEIYRDEAVGLKSCKNTWKITIFVKIWNLGQYRENLIFCP